MLLLLGLILNKKQEIKIYSCLCTLTWKDMVSIKDVEGKGFVIDAKLFEKWLLAAMHFDEDIRWLKRISERQVQVYFRASRSMYS